ncbi:MAG: acetyl-CoA carboxylase biotin carboxyl carrier protein [bacterium]
MAKTKTIRKAGGDVRTLFGRRTRNSVEGAGGDVRILFGRRTRNSAKKSKPGSNGSVPVLEEVRELYEFMNLNSLETLEFNRDDVHVRLVRKSSPQIQVPVPVVSHSRPSASRAESAQPAATQPVTGDSIKSPMTGIFFRAPSPSSPPFAKEGDSVKAGQVVCIVEAMKVFNELRAECDCVITKVLVENGKPVETNQPLFVIQKK